MSPTVSAVIMAHPKRSHFIPELRERLGRSAEVVLDRSNDRWDTGRRAMLAYDRSATHHLVVQDDAVVCRDLVAGVEKALRHVPEKTPLCLYVGRVQPYRSLVERLVGKAASDTSWLTMAQMHWGVGVVMPVELIEPCIAWGDGRPDVANYDKRISRWLGHQGITVWYPWPSLVDHRDSPSLIPGRTSVRRAHRFIGAAASALEQRYDGRVVSIPALNQAEEVYQKAYKGGPPVRFVSLKYPNLDLSNKPGLHGVKFVNGVVEVTRANAIAILQSPWWQRRGVQLATAENLKAVAALARPAPDTPQVAPAEVEPTEEPVPGGSANTVLVWVGTDPQRARRALAAERQRPKSRGVLVTKLTTLTVPKTVAGTASANVSSLFAGNNTEENPDG